jgi:hypothetical protein
MKFLLLFYLKADFGENLRLVANNEADLAEYLKEKGYKDITFSDLQFSYGTCSYRDTLNYKETAQCFYIPKI